MALPVERIRLPKRLTPLLLDTLATEVAATATRILVLEGASDVFCEGLDLDVFAEGTPSEAALIRFDDVLSMLTCHAGPVIAAVDGSAMGGGLGLAAAADLVIVTDRAT